MSRPRGPRGLKPEEEALWRQIADRTRPLRPDREKPGPRDVKPPKAVPAPMPETEAIAPFRIGQKAMPRDHVAPVANEAPKPPLRMDRKAHRRLTSGKIKPEARLDLHGMTLDQAHGALTSFIWSSQQAGRRLVLVITGKGKRGEDIGPIPTRRGVLRHQVPHWLRSGVLAPAVLDVVEAHRSHGGGGAFYVYLRRSR